LLRGRRQRLHARIAATLEDRFPEIAGAQPGLLAQHYAAAGLPEQAVTYWLKAGQQALARSAMAEAVAQLQQGLDQLALLPDNKPARLRQELELHSSLGAVLLSIKGHAAPDTGHAYARARDLWEQLGSPSDFLQVPYGQSRHYMFLGRLELAEHLDEDLLCLSRQRSDTTGLILAHYSSGHNSLLTGNFTSSQTHLGEVLALYNPTSHRSLIRQAGDDPRVNAQAALGIVLFCLGYPEQGLANSSASLADAQRLAHPPSLASSLGFCTAMLSLVGDNDALDERTSQLVELSTEQGFALWGVVGTVHRGWVMVKNGK